MFFYLISATILLVAGLLIEHIYREHLFRTLKARIMWSLVFLFIGTVWDQYGIYNHHWDFPGQGILGIKIGIIPFEEFLWYLIVPYFCLTVYKAVQVSFKYKK